MKKDKNKSKTGALRACHLPRGSGRANGPRVHVRGCAHARVHDRARDCDHVPSPHLRPKARVSRARQARVYPVVDCGGIEARQVRAAEVSLGHGSAFDSFRPHGRYDLQPL